MNRQKSKKTNSLRVKLTKSIYITVFAFFLLMSVSILKYYSYNYTEQTLDSQRSQLQSATTQIAFLQSTMNNIAKQIAADTELQSNISKQPEVSADYSLTKRKVSTSLATYSHIIEGIKEVTIYTSDRRSFSSISVRDDFNSELNDWYKKFKTSGRNTGYTEIHKSTPIQTNYQIDVISYVMAYYSADADHHAIGDLIISLNMDELKPLTKLDMTYLNGYVLYDAMGNAIVSDGTIDTTYKELEESNDTGIIKLDNGNYLLISKDMQDNWCMVSEVSGAALSQQIRTIEVYLIILFLALAVVLFLILNSFIKRIVHPINELSTAAEKVGNGDFQVAVDIHTNDELEMLADIFNEMVVDIQKYMDESVEHAKLVRKMQVDQLMLQINPHFIYNTLNSIVYMAHIKGDKEIADFANAFISLLQNTLKLRDSIYTTLEEEIQNVKYYLQLQEFRYGGKFEVEIQCPEEVKDCAIPNVVLQPVVENAIFHGLAPKDGSGHLHICGCKEGETVVICVQDDGVGMTEETLGKIMSGEEPNRSGLRKIGVANVKKRIEEIYGEPYGYTMESKVGQGTIVKISIPYQKYEERKESV